jgi:hypothetical protein
MELHPHEKAIVESFFAKGRRERYLTIGQNERQRGKWLDKLNHAPGLDERFVQWIDSSSDVLALLKSKGAPDTCYVISSSREIDRREMKLEEALAETELLGWGTVLGCIPSVLGYYYGEMGSKRGAILEKPGRRVRKSSG